MVRKAKANTIDWPRCKTCKWWTTGDYEYGFCNKVYKTCEGHQKLTTMLGVRIATGPEFGCVHHEEKQ